MVLASEPVGGRFWATEIHLSWSYGFLQILIPRLPPKELPKIKKQKFDSHLDPLRINYFHVSSPLEIMEGYRRPPYPQKF